MHFKYKIKALIYNAFISNNVRKKRFELSQPFGRYHLKVVRLPISPPPQYSFQFSVCSFQFSVEVSANVKKYFGYCCLLVPCLLFSYYYFFKTILNVVPFPISDCFTNNWPL